MVLLFAESLGRLEAPATVLRSVVTAPLRHAVLRVGKQGHWRMTVCVFSGRQCECRCGRCALLVGGCAKAQ